MGSPKKKILFATPAIGVGSEVWLHRQLTMLQHFTPAVVNWLTFDEGWDATVPKHTIHGIPPSRRKEGASKWFHRAYNLKGGNFFAPNNSTMEQLINAVTLENPSVILAHFGHTGLCMLPVARKLGIPIVVHFHGTDLSQALRNKWYRWSLIHLLPAFDASIVVGKHQRETLISLGASEHKVHYIPCGVPTGQFDRKEIGYPNSPRFISVSRLTKNKGTHISLAAFQSVAKNHPSARFRIVGYGPETNTLRNLADELGISRQVDFAGRLSVKNVMLELQNSSVFLQHSLSIDGSEEGFGVSIAEAASMKLPVVVSNIGGIPDQVIHGRTGYIVEQNDVKSMAKYMDMLARDRDLCTGLGLAGRKNVIANFDTNNQIEKLETVMLNCIKV